MCEGRSRADGCGAAVTAAGLVVAAMLAAYRTADAATLYASPGDNLNSKISLMQPGDTLILNPGDYLSTLRVTGRNGDPDHWFTVRGSDAGFARICSTGYVNMIEFKRSSYWRFENLELDGDNYTGSEAFKTQWLSDPNWDFAHHIVLDSLDVHHFQDVCISTKVATWDLTIRNCHIHDTNSVGLYLGNSDGYHPLMNFVFENNFVERTARYNMQIKHQWERIGVARGDWPGLEFDSWGWLIRDSVFMRTYPPADAARPNLLVDAAPATGPGSDDLATITGNVVLGNVSGAYGDHGFQLSGNIRVCNNLVVNVTDYGVSGIRVGFHNIYPRHVEILNNTVMILGGSSTTRCLTVTDLVTGDWPQVIANNALIRGSTGYVAFSGSLPGGAIATNNIIRGTGAQPGFVETTAALDELFVSPVETPGAIDLYPADGSPLLGAGSNAYAPIDDFNGVPRPRGGTVDVGAYERLGPTNPGWQVDLARKILWRFGDLDHDGDVDLADESVLTGLLTGPGGAMGNPEADLEEDGDCDMREISAVASNFTGAIERDTTPPAAITDLVAQSGSRVGQVDLTWTAPGDDGQTGTAARYELHYAIEPITDDNWDQIFIAWNLPGPSPAGTAEHLTVTSLSAGRLYYFAIKTRDEARNLSAMSNVASAMATY